MSEAKKSLAEAIGTMAELGAVFAGEVHIVEPFENLRIWCLVPKGTARGGGGGGEVPKLQIYQFYVVGPCRYLGRRCRWLSWRKMIPKGGSRR